MALRDTITSRSFSSLSGGLGQNGSHVFGAVGHPANTLRPYVTLKSSAVVPADDKETMKGLNERLADYLSKVRLLEETNTSLEQQITDTLMRSSRGSSRDWSSYGKTVTDLRNQIQELLVEHGRLLLQIDNARLAADDFKVKFSSEEAMRHGVQQDLTRLRKMLDDTYMSRMQLEGQIEAMREELAFLKKSHEEDVANLRNQISDSQVNVQMESKNSADLNEIINNMRLQYERATQKSQQETEAWYQNKFDNIAAEVTQNTEALQSGRMELNELRRQKQSLEIDLQTLHNMIHSLEDTLRDTEARYGQEVSGYNSRILQLEVELGQVRGQVEHQAAEYQMLLNLKMKLEAEISTYQHLLEGVGDNNTDNDSLVFSLEQVLSAAPPPDVCKKTIIIHQELVDGEVVSQTEHEQNTHLNHQTGYREEEEFVEEDEEASAETKGDEVSYDAAEQNE